MKNHSFRAQLADYILSAHAYLHVPTTERSRFLSELKDLAESLPDGGRQVFTWSPAVGWRDGDCVDHLDGRVDDNSRASVAVSTRIEPSPSGTRRAWERNQTKE